MQRYRCCVCGSKLRKGKFGKCPACKRTQKNICEAHGGAGDPGPKSEGQESRVEVYAAIIKNGGRIFE